MKTTGENETKEIKLTEKIKGELVNIALTKAPLVRAFGDNRQASKLALEEVVSSLGDSIELPRNTTIQRLPTFVLSALIKANIPQTRPNQEQALRSFALVTFKDLFYKKTTRFGIELK